MRREEVAGLGWRAEVGRKVRRVEAVDLRVLAIVYETRLIKRDWVQLPINVIASECRG